MTVIHTHTHTQTVGILWTRDRNFARASDCKTRNINKGQTSILLVVFELLIPAREWPQTLHLPTLSRLDRSLCKIIRKKTFLTKVQGTFNEMLQVHAHFLYAVMFSFEFGYVCVCVCVCVFCVGVGGSFYVRLYICLCVCLSILHRVFWCAYCFHLT